MLGCICLWETRRYWTESMTSLQDTIKSKTDCYLYCTDARRLCCSCKSPRTLREYTENDHITSDGFALKRRRSVCAVNGDVCQIALALHVSLVQCCIAETSFLCNQICKVTCSWDDQKARQPQYLHRAQDITVCLAVASFSVSAHSEIVHAATRNGSCTAS